MIVYILINIILFVKYFMHSFRFSSRVFPLTL